MQPPPVFELVDPVLANTSALTGSAATPLIGLWQPVQPASPDSLSRSLEDTLPVTDGPIDPIGTIVPIWRANLPADPAQSAAFLEQGTQRLSTFRHSLPHASERLEALVACREGGTDFKLDSDKDDISFDIGTDTSAPVLQAPESELLNTVDSLNHVSYPQADVSFAVGVPNEGERGGSSNPPSLWQQEVQQVQTLARHVLHTVAYYAWVETIIEGRLVGRTSVGWTGSMETLWVSLPDTHHSTLHAHVLDLSLASRAALIRNFVLVLQGAVRISVLISAPGGALLAIPAAWKFFNQIVAEKR